MDVRTMFDLTFQLSRMTPAVVFLKSDSLSDAVQRRRPARLLLAVCGPRTTGHREPRLRPAPLLPECLFLLDSTHPQDGGAVGGQPGPSRPDGAG